MRDDDLGHLPQVVVEDGHDAGRIAVLRESRVAAQVGHEHGDLALAAAERQPVRRLEHGAGDLGGDVPAEGVANDLALAQPLDHRVEGAREVADLVARAHGGRLREIAGGDSAGGAGQRDDRPRESPGEDDGQHDRQQHAGDAAQGDRLIELAQAVEIEIDRIVDLEHGRRGATRVEDRREGADAHATARAIDARIARHPVLERPRDGVRGLRPDRHRLTRALVVGGGHDDARASADGVIAGQRTHRRREQSLLANGGQRPDDPAIGGCVGSGGTRGLGVCGAVDHQRAHARDV